MDSKPWYASRGVMGSLFGALASAVIFYNSVAPSGAEVPPEIAEQVGSENTVIAFVAVGGFIASIVSWIGRVGAEKPISSRII
jgi:hypothetical protein